MTHHNGLKEIRETLERAQRHFCKTESCLTIVEDMYNALAILDDLEKAVPKPIKEPEKLKGCLSIKSLYTLEEAYQSCQILYEFIGGGDE